MSILTYPLGFIGGGKVFYNGVMENSCLFSKGAQTELRSYSVGQASTTTATCSLWLKRAARIGEVASGIIGAGISNVPRNAVLDFNTADEIFAEGKPPEAGAAWGAATSAVYRDPSAWYHICAVFDSNHSIEADRYRVYVNGERQVIPSDDPVALSLGENINWIGADAASIALVSFSMCSERQASGEELC